jgi:hypothetical protein
MKKPLHIDPKAVCKAALALDPMQIVIITEGPSGHIDVFASDGGAYEMLKRARQHMNRLADA